MPLPGHLQTRRKSVYLLSSAPVGWGWPKGDNSPTPGAGCPPGPAGVQCRVSQGHGVQSSGASGLVTLPSAEADLGSGEERWAQSCPGPGSASVLQAHVSLRTQSPALQSRLGAEPSLHSAQVRLPRPAGQSTGSLRGRPVPPVCSDTWGTLPDDPVPGVLRPRNLLHLLRAWHCHSQCSPSSPSVPGPSVAHPQKPWAPHVVRAHLTGEKTGFQVREVGARGGPTGRVRPPSFLCHHAL